MQKLARLTKVRAMRETATPWYGAVDRCALPLLTLCLGGFLVFLLPDLRSESLLTQSIGAEENVAAAAAADDDSQPSLLGRYNFSVLIGVLTLPGKYERRHFLRLVYAAQEKPLADMDVKFVFCNLTTAEEKMMIALEILRFDDIIILNCTENMDGGKTYTYFSSLPAILSRRYDYVMKADDDTYIGLGALARSLQPLPREDLYYGYVTPCKSKNPFSGYMSGMGYLLSWDLAEWISASEIPRDNAIGIEDLLVGKWLNDGKKARNRFTAKPEMYDFPVGKRLTCSAHELVPETVAIHRVKKRERWMEVVKFFNLTKQLKPSTLYRIDWRQ